MNTWEKQNCWRQNMWKNKKKEWQIEKVLNDYTTKNWYKK